MLRVGRSCPVKFGDSETLTQPLFTDMFRNFDKLVADKSSRKSSLLNFGHEATIESFLNALGLSTDDHDLLASEYYIISAVSECYFLKFPPSKLQ